MLNKSEAKELLLFKFPGVRVESGIDYENLWVFRAFLPIGGGEENMNPFMSVEKETGVVSDFSITACPDPMLLVERFSKEDSNSSQRR